MRSPHRPTEPPPGASRLRGAEAPAVNADRPGLPGDRGADDTAKPENGAMTDGNDTAPTPEQDARVGERRALDRRAGDHALPRL
jgi:hypothetical protein